MKKLDADLGKIYHKDDFYYLEKIFDSLGELMDQEGEIKKRAKRHGFKVVKTHWAMEENPYYYIETVLNEYDTDDLDPLRYVYKVKLKYIK